MKKASLRVILHWFFPLCILIGLGCTTGSDGTGDVGGSGGGVPSASCPSGNEDDCDGDGYEKPYDCNDYNDRAHPHGGAEICDGADNDCDGEVDNIREELTDPNGQSYIRKLGDPCGSSSVYPCQLGHMVCIGDKFACNSIEPNHERCNGKDDDCNGEVDDVKVRWCSTGLPGVCDDGETLCAAGIETCEVLIEPGTVEEICDEADNDCNGEVDDVQEDGINGDGDPYIKKPGDFCHDGTKLGVCANGVLACNGSGPMLACKTPEPSVEKCNGLDDNCNGVFDDGLVDSKGNVSRGLCPAIGKKGPCADGEWVCDPVNVGADYKCTQVYDPKPEVCNGFDDNCSGTTDENQVCGN